MKFRSYGTKCSLRARQEDRLRRNFETLADAEERTKEEKSAIKNNVKKPHNHIGN